MDLSNATLVQYQSGLFSTGNDSIRVEENNGEVVYQVPIREGNADYAEIMRQVEAGKLTIEDAE